MKRTVIQNGDLHIELVDLSLAATPSVSVTATLTPSTNMAQTGYTQYSLKVYRIIAISVMSLFLPLPWIDYENMIYLYHNWSYLITLITFGLLIYASYQTTVNATFDKYVRMTF
jgi:hypothetical protein